MRGTFLALLKAAHGRGQLVCKGQLQSLESHAAFNAWLSPLYAKDWVVYAQPPWNGPEHALKYLARHTHRVAIANSRLQSIDNGQVTFTYKDYRHEHRQRTLTLSALEFMRRFLLHVVPAGFMRIRYYGFLANAHREEQLRKIRELLSASPVADTDADHGDSPSDSASPSDDLRCPLCKQGVMVTIETTPRPKLSEILHLPLMVPT